MWFLLDTIELEILGTSLEFLRFIQVSLCCFLLIYLTSSMIGCMAKLASSFGDFGPSLPIMSNTSYCNVASIVTDRSCPHQGFLEIMPSSLRNQQAPKRLAGTWWFVLADRTLQVLSLFHMWSFSWSLWGFWDVQASRSLTLVTIMSWFANVNQHLPSGPTSLSHCNEELR